MDKQRALSYIKKHNMIEKGDIVIVALSGGADSMALFHFLLSEAAELGINVCAAHVNHKMRKESDCEAQGVAALCDKLGVELFSKTLTAPENPGEEWARNERYAFFSELLQNKPGAKIATAHTASDNAETVLFRLCRGTALRGAGGIPPVRGAFIRPLLCFTREEIESYCKLNSLKFYTDLTNLTSQYARGYIRNSVFPLLNYINPSAKQAFARFAENAKEAQAFIDEQAFLLLQKAKRANGYSASVIAKASSAPAKAALYNIISPYGEVDEQTITACYELLFKKSGTVNLPNNMALVLQNKTIYAASQKNENKAIDFQPLREGFYTFMGGRKLKCEIKECEEILNYLKVEKKGLIFCADYGRIQFDACFRSRKSGDTFTFKGRNVTKTLKKYMNEKGIPRGERGCVPLLAHENRVLWLWGEGFCEGLDVDENTKKVLVITICNTEEA